MDRRDFSRQLSAMLAAAGLGGTAASLAGAQPPAARTRVPADSGADQPPIPSGPPLEIALLAFPGMTALDLVAPQLAFSMLPNVRVQVVAKTRDVVVCDSGLGIQPAATLDECPRQLDVLFTPGSGGPGTAAAMRDDAVVEFLRDRGSRARWVTSVCTGAYLLGAAGLLRGYRAATWWPTREGLRALGATPVAARFVQDRNRITGGGITAGLDFGLHVSRLLRGDAFARTQQLVLEYDPKPPFAGSPEREDPAVVAGVRRRVARGVRALADAAEEAGARLRA